MGICCIVFVIMMIVEGAKDKGKSNSNYNNNNYNHKLLVVAVEEGELEGQMEDGNGL